MNRYMHVVFCDDVRQEVGNKQSLIGIYGADLFVNEMPIALPRLSIVITMATEASNPLQSLSFVILKGAERVAEIVIPAEELAKAQPIASGQQAPPIEGDDGPSAPSLFAYNAILSIAPFPIEKPQVLRVIATIDGEEIRGPGLRLRLTPTATTGQPTEGESPSTPAPLH